LAQIFPTWTTPVTLVVIHAAAPAPLLIAGLLWWFGSPKYTDVGYQPEQPVPFSHKVHAGDLGIDCRYCHASIEESHEANIPPAQTCMNCHRSIKKNSEALAPVRESYETGKPINWVRVHKLPEYAYFDHSVHLKAGVGCTSCHGDIDRQEIVTQRETLSMGWCLDCHRHPHQHIRDLTETSVTDMEWQPAKGQYNAAEAIIQEKELSPPEDCAACHR